ncbi:MAG TPA: hypothetical protein VKP66_12680 [Steroidobacteraceae bacterium]|nr:hypothetical protein [Steroidobacteraceae bacterium]
MDKRRPRETLDDLLDLMPRNVEPPRALWPGIAREITRARQSSRRFAMAASVAAACLAGALIWVVLHASSTPRGSTIARSASESFNEPRDPAYVAARAGLESSFRERLGTLDPRTRAAIESNLRIIRQAHEDIRRALAEQPANPVLEHLFESTWHDEFDLYDSVVRGTQWTTTRS